VVKTQDEEQMWEENQENCGGREREMGRGRAPMGRLVLGTTDGGPFGVRRLDSGGERWWSVGENFGRNAQRFSCLDFCCSNSLFSISFFFIFFFLKKKNQACHVGTRKRDG
jgi:hypothetical protein